MSTGGGTVSEREKLIHADVYNMKYYFVTPHTINH